MGYNQVLLYAGLSYLVVLLTLEMKQEVARKVSWSWVENVGSAFEFVASHQKARRTRFGEKVACAGH